MYLRTYYTLRGLDNRRTRSVTADYNCNYRRASQLSELLPIYYNVTLSLYTIMYSGRVNHRVSYMGQRLDGKITKIGVSVTVENTWQLQGVANGVDE